MRISRDPMRSYKFLSAFCIIGIYLLYLLCHGSGLPRRREIPLSVHIIQKQTWDNGTGLADERKVAAVVKAAKRTFELYRSKAWGYDDIKPVSGGTRSSRNGWGAFIVDSSTTLALMGLWDELSYEIEYMVQTLDFGETQELVDPFETTIRYLGGLVSLVDLIDAGVVPKSLASREKRDKILEKAIILSNKLAPAYDTPCGLLWPRVNFKTGKGVNWPGADSHSSPSVSLARTGSNFLENRVLTRLSGNDIYFRNASRAWSTLVWNRYVEVMPGLVDSPRDVHTGKPVKREKSWDSGHDSYYEYLLKSVILSPYDAYTTKYQERWLEAAGSLRHNLSSRSSPTDSYAMQHLFLGKFEGQWLINEMSHLAFFAPGNLILGGSLLERQDLLTFGKALLEGCHHIYDSTTSGIGPEAVSWRPKVGEHYGTYIPETNLQMRQSTELGFWIVDPHYKLRPEYAESLFYAWRITGEQRYREWAWDAFQAIEKNCKAEFGYASISNVTKEPSKMELLDESESFWMAETLKYFYLIFSDVHVGSLDTWVFNTEGHPLRRTVPG